MPALRTLVIVPAYNEARNLPHVIESVRSALPACDICVVDDGSSDGTATVAAGSGAMVLRHAVNLGIGGAVQAGYLWARDHGYDLAVQIDGDGQHNPAFVPALVAPVLEGRADLVVGSRFLGREGFLSTRVRRLGIGYLSVLVRVVCGATVTDPTSGFRAAGRSAIELFAGIYPSDYPEPESIAVARRHGLRVTEVPVRMDPRRHGQSSIGFRRSLYYLVKVSLELLLHSVGSPQARAGTKEPT